MTQANLEDVESYLVKRAAEEHYTIDQYGMVWFFNKVFAELRAREQSKLDTKAREAVEANSELIADIEAEEAIRGP